MYAFNLQLQMHKYYFDILIYYLTNKKKVECEIKTTSRWQQVTVNKWVIAIEPNHLNVGTKHAQRHKTVLWLCLELFLFLK